MALNDVVLVATDLSDSADDAIRAGHELAQGAGKKFVVCHIVHEILRASPLFPHAVQADMEAVIHAESRAAAAVEDRVVALTGRASTDFEIRIESGAADSAILRVAEDVKATVVVTASRGLSGITRLLLGSVAERIVRYAHCSVLIARPHKKTNKILVATDLSDLSLPAVSLAAEAAKRNSAELVVLYALDVFPSPAMGLTVPFGGVPIVPPPELIAQMRAGAHAALEALVARLDVKAEPRVAEGDATAAIIRTAEQVEADLVVVATHGRTGLARVALGSVAEKVVRGARSSVLVARSPVPTE
jgi:nucleotide-binding universal stress UspA family protein